MGALKGVVDLVSDIAKSLLIVAVVSAALYGYSGMWPPLVVVESGSMEPNMYRGDIILMKNVDPVGSQSVDTFREDSAIHFGKPGDVVVYNVPNDGRATPIIHRAMYWVDAGDPLWNGEVARTSGYVTKGDNNGATDQRIGIADDPISPSWIQGRAVYRVPYVGYVRLLAGELLHF